MRNICYLLLLVLLSLSNLSAQITWQRVHPKLADYLQDIAVIDDSIAVACGSKGGIFTTSNGGTTWSTASSNTQVDLYGITYAGTGLWAVGAGGTILFSADSGSTWNAQGSAVGELHDVFFLNGSEGWVCGERGIIYNTTDGGANWTVQNIMNLTNGWLREIYFINSSIGFVVGSSQSYGRTTDGGASWTITEAASFSSQYNYDIEFRDNLNGWIVGNGDASQTTDGGVTWSNNGLTSAQFGNQIMYDIDWVTSSIGYIFGSGGKIAKTTDGGVNWTFQTLSNGQDFLYAGDFSSSTNGYVVGMGGIIYKTSNGSTWNSLIATITSKNLNSCYFFDNNIGYAVGDQGTIIKTINGGTSWSDESSKLNTSNALYDIYFPSANVGYIGGDNAIFKTEDGGSTWTSITATKIYYSVKFLNENIGWFAGDISTGYIAKTTNRGASWSISTPASPVYDIEIVNATTLVGVGFQGSITRTTNGGSTWGSVVSPISVSLNAVDFYDDGELGIACGNNGEVIRTTDGGVTWTRMDAYLTTTNSLNDIHIINPQNIYAVGSGGLTITSNDVGVSWTDVSDNMTDMNFNSIVFSDRSHAWRVGGGGNVHFGTDQTASQPPAPAIGVNPLFGDTDISVSVVLKWMDSGAAAPTGYKLYFGTDGNGTAAPTNLVNGIDLGNVTSYTPSPTLSYNTTYYWQIVPYNSNGDALFCPIWKFTTRQDINFGGGGTTAPGYFFANSTPSAIGAPSQPSYSWVDPISNGHIAVANLDTWNSGNADDGFLGPISMNMTFPFFGVNYTSAYIGTNGVITFSGGYSGTGASASIPNATSPNNMIAVLMMDLDSINVSADVYYGVGGNKFIVTWYHYSAKGTTDEITFQVILNSNGYIEFQYNDTESTFPLPSSIGNDALIGIEDQFGTSGVQYRNNGVGGPIFGSPVTVGFGDNQSALPVELNYFSAVQSGSEINLNWRTATEINNYGFEVERIGGKSHNWEKIAFIQGAGNSNSPKEYYFVDAEVFTGKKEIISYRLKQIDTDGAFEYSETVQVKAKLSSTKFSLEQNFPNPFNPTTKIRYSIPTDSKVTLKLYDILGKEVAVLVNEQKTAGNYTLNFNASNFSSGVYLYKLTSGKFIKVKKLMLVK